MVSGKREKSYEGISDALDWADSSAWLERPPYTRKPKRPQGREFKSPPAHQILRVKIVWTGFQFQYYIQVNSKRSHAFWRIA